MHGGRRLDQGGTPDDDAEQAKRDRYRRLTRQLYSAVCMKRGQLKIRRGPTPMCRGAEVASFPKKEFSYENS